MVTITDFPLFKTSLNYSSNIHLDYIALNKTLFSNIQKVQPGEYIKYHKKKITSHKYWKFTQKIKNNLSEEDTIKKRLEEICRLLMFQLDYFYQEELTLV